MSSLEPAVLEKPALRAMAMGRRDSLPPAERARASLAIADRAGALLGELRPRVVAGYLPIRSEVDVRPLLEAARAAGAIIALPAILDSTTIRFRRYGPEGRLVLNRFGTLAPDEDAPEVVPDLVILPMVGFDRTGARLGHGKGFYDRLLGNWPGRRPALLGIAFAAQEVPAIPREAHDLRLDWAVTERETLDFRGNSA